MSEINQDPNDDQWEAYRLHRCMGMSQSEVATRFGVTQQCVSKWVALVRDYLRYAKREELTSLRADLTSRWENLYYESMRAWTRSQATEVVTTRKNEAGVESKTTRETPQVGACQFLKMAGTALVGIANLWEADMLATSRQGDIRSVGKSQRELIDDQMKRLSDMKAKLKTTEGGGAGDRGVRVAQTETWGLRCDFNGSV